eukprot:c25903_g1_i1.p1 GENE.c25903_g1_i1~~c25903_g1_i1.p1  ORF type:complete len:1167 (-),score=308.56 c25903_g1_i1:164-3664(-)
MDLVSACKIPYTSANPQELAQANQVCDEFMKQDTATLTSTAASLFASHSEDVVKFFALKCIEVAVKRFWEGSAPANEKIAFRDNVVRLITTSLQPGDAKFVKEKRSSLIVELVERMWPQHWPNLLDTLIDISRNGGVYLDLVLNVLAGMFQDAVEGSRHLSEKRRHELLTGLNVILPQILPFLTNILETAHTNTAPDTSLKVLQCFSHVASWVMPDVLVPHQLCNTVAAVYQSPSSPPALKLPCLRVFQCFLDRKLRSEECETSMPILNIVSQLAGTHNFSNMSQHEINCEMTTIVSRCAIHRIMALERAPNTQTALTALASDVQLLLSLAMHPSLRLSASTLPVWISFVRSPRVIESGFVRHVMPSLLRVCLRRLVRDALPSSTSQPQTIAQRFAEIDFSEYEEVREALNKMGADCANIIRESAMIFQVEAYTFAVQVSESAIQSLITSTSPPVSDAAQLQSSELGQNLRAAMTILEHVTGALENRPLEPNQSADHTKLDEANQLVMTQAAALHSFAHYHEGVKQALLLEVLKMLRSCIAFPTPVEGGSSLQQAIVVILQLIEAGIDNKVNGDVLRSACFALTHACHTSGSRVLPLMSSVVSRCGELMTRPGASNFTKASLYDALTALSNHLPSADMQMPFISSLLQDVGVQLGVCSQWTSQPSALISCLGLDLPFPDDPAIQRRQHLGHCCRILRIVLQRLDPSRISVIDVVCREFAPFFLGVIRCIHGLFSPLARSRFHPNSSSVLELCASDINQILGHDAVQTVAVADDPDNTTDFTDALLGMQRWLSHAQDQSHRFVNDVIRKSNLVKGDPRACQAVCESAMSFSQNLPWRHLSSLADLVFSPLVSMSGKDQAPGTDCSAVLSVSAIHTITFLDRISQSLHQAWQGHTAPSVVIATNISASGTLDAQTVNELVLDKHLRQCSRSVAATLLALFGEETDSSATASGGQSQPPPQQTTPTPTGTILPLTRFVLSDAQLTACVLEVMCRIVSWPDSLSTRKALSVMQRLVGFAGLVSIETMTPSPDFIILEHHIAENILAKVMTSCLLVASLPQHKELQPDAFNMVLEVILASESRGLMGCLTILAQALGTDASNTQQLITSVCLNPDKRSRRLAFRKAVGPVFAGAQVPKSLIDIVEPLTIVRPPPQPTDDSDEFLAVRLFGF